MEDARLLPDVSEKPLSAQLSYSDNDLQPHRMADVLESDFAMGWELFVVEGRIGDGVCFRGLRTV